MLLEIFVKAQERSYAKALAELKVGAEESNWGDKLARWHGDKGRELSSRGDKVTWGHGDKWIKTDFYFIDYHQLMKYLQLSVNI